VAAASFKLIFHNEGTNYLYYSEYLVQGSSFCGLIFNNIVMLHSFIKKSDRTPLREIDVAETRMKEVKHANT
jgi:Phage derived protein Gp49-like (DUF891)